MTLDLGYEVGSAGWLAEVVVRQRAKVTAGCETQEESHNNKDVLVALEAYQLELDKRCASCCYWDKTTHIPAPHPNSGMARCSMRHGYWIGYASCSYWRGELLTGGA